MRKHVKTVHGAEFYANKKHKGINNGSDGRSDDSGNRGPDNSPRNDDSMSGKAASLSSPSIKSESDANSPGQQQINSPMSVSHLASGYCEEYDNMMPNDQMGSVSAMDDPAWPYEDENLDVSVRVFGKVFVLFQKYFELYHRWLNFRWFFVQWLTLDQQMPWQRCPVIDLEIV